MSLRLHGLPILFTLFLWWFSTGAILYLDGLPRRTYRWSLGGASIALLAAFYALHLTAQDASIGSAYCAFSCALVVWGWVEMSFLMGLVTGPRTSTCPPGLRGWRRASAAFETVAHHEVALLLGALAIALLTWEAPNQLALETFGVLWVARGSAKLNVFLGARNLSEEFLPEHLRYLQSYFRRAPMNLLFPLSVTAGTAASTALWVLAANPGQTTSDAVSLSFLATLATLATLEHWFLMLPIPSGALWDWGLRSRKGSTAPMAGEVRARVL